MKKLYAFMAVALVCASTFAAPATVPTVADLAGEYDVTNNIVLCLYFDEEVCNDIVLAGSYNEWATDPATMKKFAPLTGFEGWYAVEFPFTADAVPQGKPVQLKSDGTFTWDFQSGDVPAWIYKTGNTATVEPGYASESDVSYPTAGAYIYEIAYFKNHNSPCGDNLTWTLVDSVLTISGTGAMEDYSYYSSTPWYANRSSIRSVIISDGVTSIGNYVFYDCESLTSVTIPNSVTSIGNSAFASCFSLTSMTIGNSVTSIENYTFSGCSSLTSVTIPNSVTSIGDWAFYGCDKLVDVYCYATTPPATEGENTFSQYDAFLYVPCESKKAYMVDAVWGNFKYIECISSEGIEDVQSDEVQSTKVLRNGQVLILRNGKTYTMQGQEVK